MSSNTVNGKGAGVTDAAAFRGELGLGTASTEDVGILPNQVVQRDGSGNIPANGIILRTGTDAELATVVLQQGEIAVPTDNPNRIRVGRSGVDVGGVVFDSVGGGNEVAGGFGTLTLIADASDVITGFSLSDIPFSWKENQPTLKALQLGSDVKSIAGLAFINNSGFTGRLNLPKGLLTIGDAAFGGCSGFTGDLVIPDSVTSVGSQAFDGCTGIADIYVNLNAANFPSDAIQNMSAGNLYVTATYIASYGGDGASYGPRTVTLWTSYPAPMP